MAGTDSHRISLLLMFTLTSFIFTSRNQPMLCCSVPLEEKKALLSPD
jgi:hypothetical protein